LQETARQSRGKLQVLRLGNQAFERQGKEAMKIKPVKYAVVVDSERKYIAKEAGMVLWTYDKAEAEQIAKLVNGRVVDADAWVKNPVFIDLVSSSSG
jgi:hypothetical protein